MDLRFTPPGWITRRWAGADSREANVSTVGELARAAWRTKLCHAATETQTGARCISFLFEDMDVMN